MKRATRTTPAQPRRAASPQPSPAAPTPPASLIGERGVSKHKPGLAPVVPIKWAKETPKAPPPSAPQTAATNGDGYLSVEVDDGFLAAIDKARALPGLSREDFCIAAVRERMARLSAEKADKPATNGQQAITVSLPVKVAAELDDLTRRFGVDRAETVTVALRSLQRVLNRVHHIDTLKANSRKGLYPWPGDVTHLPGNADLIAAVDLACAMIDLLGAKAYPTTNVDTGDAPYAANCGAGQLMQLAQDDLVDQFDAYDARWDQYLAKHLPQAFAKPSTQPEAA